LQRLHLHRRFRLRDVSLKNRTALWHLKCADSLAKSQKSVTGFDRPHENEQGNRKPFHRVMAIVCGALSGAPGLGCSPRPVNLHTTATFRLTAKLQQLFQLNVGTNR